MENRSRQSRGRKIGLAVITVLYVISFDFWNWQDTARIWGLPRFVVFIFVMQLALSFCFYAFSGYFWPSGNSQPPDGKESE